MKKGTGAQPCEFHSRFVDIHFASLAGRGHFIIDIDNTLALTHSSEVSAEIMAHLTEARAQGYIKELCLVSNLISRSERRLARVEKIATTLGASFVGAYGRKVKPHRQPFIEAMQKMGSTPENTVVIGDQLFTDITGGNRLGLYTVYILPLGPDAWFTRPKRWLERLLRRRWERGS